MEPGHTDDRPSAKRSSSSSSDRVVRFASESLHQDGDELAAEMSRLEVSALSLTEHSTSAFSCLGGPGHTILGIFGTPKDTDRRGVAVGYFESEAPDECLLCSRSIGGTPPRFIGPAIPFEKSFGYCDFGLKPPMVPLISFSTLGFVLVCDMYGRMAIYNVNDGTQVFETACVTRDGLLVRNPTAVSFQLLGTLETGLAIMIVLVASFSEDSTTIFSTITPFTVSDDSSTVWTETKCAIREVQSVVFDSMVPQLAWFSSASGPMSMILNSDDPNAFVIIPSTNWVEGTLKSTENSDDEHLELSRLCHTVRLCVGTLFAAKTPGEKRDRAAKLNNQELLVVHEDLAPTKVVMDHGRMVTCSPGYAVFSSIGPVSDVCERGILPVPLTGAIDVAVSADSDIVAFVTDSKTLWATRWPNAEQSPDKAVMFLRDPDDGPAYRKASEIIPQHMIFISDQFIISHASGGNIYVFEAFV